MTVRVCDFCEERIRHQPFARTVGDEMFLYCSSNCLHNHWKFQCDMGRLQGRFNNL